MADMYSIVKKQDEKIDDILKIAQENKDLLVGIDTRLVAAPAPVQTPTPVSTAPQTIQVELPSNVATNESVKTTVEAALKQQKKDIAQKLDFSDFSKDLADAFVTIFKDGLDQNVKNALYEGINREFSRQTEGLKEAAERLRERMYSIVNGAVWAAIPKWAYAVVIAVFGIAVGLGIFERVSYDADGIRNMMLREEAMMVGSKQEQDSIKTMTIQLEHRKHAERTHVYFRPSDSWTPESGNLFW